MQKLTAPLRDQCLSWYVYGLGCADFPDPDLTFQMLREKEKENKNDQKKKDPSSRGLMSNSTTKAIDTKTTLFLTVL